MNTIPAIVLIVAACAQGQSVKPSVEPSKERGSRPVVVERSQEVGRRLDKQVQRQPVRQVDRRSPQDQPAYTPDGKKFNPNAPQRDESRLPERIQEILRRQRETARREGSPTRTLTSAGCMDCHSTLKGISTQTFVEHIEKRRNGKGYFHDMPRAFGGEVMATAPAPGEKTGAEHLKEAIDASGQSVRPAGNMATEMAREKWEAMRREQQAKEVQEKKAILLRAIELMEEGKHADALPLMKEHIAKQIAFLKNEEKRAEEARAAKEGKDTNAAPEPAVSDEGAKSDAAKELTAEEKAAAELAIAMNAMDIEDTRRALAYLLLMNNQADAASAVVREMYRADPYLVQRPLDAARFHIRERDLSAAFAASVSFANRAKTGSSWLMAAMLAQSQGRHDLAKSMAEKGAASGLERELADAFAIAATEAAEVAKAKRAAKPANAPDAAPKNAPK